MAGTCKREAFVSLTTNDFYATGALTLGRSLRNTGTTRKLALVITSGVSEQMRHALSMVWDEVILVDEIDSGDADSLAVLRRPELGVTFTKIAVWKLTQYTKCVFLDADTLVLCNVDELFLREELSAAPDVGWPDCFNSGVFVFCPSLETFRHLLTLAQQIGSFDGGDQGLLNKFWDNWHRDDIKYHLPFIYNLTPNSCYCYAPAFLRFKDKIKIVHFIGNVKPWQHTYLWDLDTVVLMPGTYSSQNCNQDFILRWWKVYSSLVLELTSHNGTMEDKHVQSLSGNAKLSHRREFELGNIDYHGRDRFENIMALIEKRMGDSYPSSSRSSSFIKSGHLESSPSKSEEPFSIVQILPEAQEGEGNAQVLQEVAVRQRSRKGKSQQGLLEDKDTNVEETDSREFVKVTNTRVSPPPKAASASLVTWVIIIFTLLFLLLLLYMWQAKLLF